MAELMTKEQQDEMLRVNKELEVRVKELSTADVIKKAELENVKAELIEMIHGKSEKHNLFSSEHNEEAGRKFIKGLKAMKNHDIAVLKTIMDEGTSADGGYTVPITTGQEIFGELYNESVIMQKVTTIPQGLTFNMPTWDTGISVYWVAEDGKLTPVKFALSYIPLVLKKLTAMVPFTNELLDDSIVDISALCTEKVAEKFALEYERVILNGDVTGNSDPFNGITKATGIKSVAQKGDTLQYQDIINCISNPNLLERFHSGAEIYLNRTTLNIIMSLVDGNNRPLWNLGSPLAGFQSSILGKPYNVTDQISNSGASFSLVYGNFKNVLVGRPMKKSDVRIEVSNSAVTYGGDGTVTQSAFQQDELMYRFIKRGSVGLFGPAFSVLTGVK